MNTLSMYKTLCGSFWKIEAGKGVCKLVKDAAALTLLVLPGCRGLASWALKHATPLSPPSGEGASCKVKHPGVVAKFQAFELTFRSH